MTETRNSTHAEPTVGAQSPGKGICLSFAAALLNWVGLLIFMAFHGILRSVSPAIEDVVGITLVIVVPVAILILGIIEIMAGSRRVRSGSIAQAIAAIIGSAVILAGMVLFFMNPI